MSYKNKIKNIEEIKEILKNLRQEGRKIVHCHGCFDLVHPGHVYQLYEAKKLGDLLIVSITADEFVKKGPHRPFLNEKARAEVLAALEPVDFVVIDKNESSAELLKITKPDIYVKGKEYLNLKHPGLLKEKEVVESNGGEVVFLEMVPDGLGGEYSSTKFIEKIVNHLKEESKR
jgi:rfaE bifunctional protein nucleotidyltransferase chain/domain